MGVYDKRGILVSGTKTYYIVQSRHLSVGAVGSKHKWIDGAKFELYSDAKNNASEGSRKAGRNY